jgi:serine/threonine protein kinase
MKLLFENWRKFVNEEASFDLKNAATAEDPGSPKARKAAFMTRVKETANKLGFHYIKKLGEGQMGEVFLVENKETGERNALKVVTDRLYGGPATSEQEARNYRFAMENKASMPEKYAKYLPDVYKVFKGDKDYYIFMEVLQEIPDRVKVDLFRLNSKDFSLDRYEKYVRILRDPEATYDIILTALYGNLILVQGDKEVMENILHNVPNKVIKKIIEDTDTDWGWKTVDTLADLIVQESMEYLQQGDGYYESLPDSFRDSLRLSLDETFDKQIIPIHQGHGRVSHAGRSPESIEKLFPEAQSLMAAMRYFHDDQKWQPKDVHSGNVMVRAGTKDFVITDLGLFS